jgi:TRAP-type C4-dicarboxylate transport system permease small subunit
VTLRWLDRAVETLLALALLALLAIGTAQVVLRYAFSRPLPWALEASILLLVWATMLCGYIGVRRDAHLSADFLGWSGQGRLRQLRDSLGVLLCVIFLAAYGLSSFKVIDAMDGIPFTALPFEQPVLYWSLPVGAALMALAFAARVAASWRQAAAAPGSQ